MELSKEQKELIEDFEMIPEWPDKYEYIMQIGKELGVLPAEFQTDAYKVKGCQSNVWLIPENKDGKLFFKGDSDALIVKGLVALVLKVYSGKTYQEIIEENSEFINLIGLGEHLSPTRSNGLSSMIKQIKYYAIAYQSKSNN